MKNYLHKPLLAVFLSFFATSLIHSQNNSLNFDGVDDLVNCNTILPQSYTKEAWIYITDLTKFNNIVSGDGSSNQAFWAPIMTGNKLSAGHVNPYTQVQDSDPLLANTWYHVAVTYDAPSKTMRLYKNGVEVSSSTTVDPLANNGQVFIGGYAGGNVFQGNIDEVRIWNGARSASQIGSNIFTSFDSPQSGLVANYRFNQGTANGDNTRITALIDESGNINTSGLVGFALIGTTSNFIPSTIVLPVELLSFNASPLAGSPSNLLTWQTANEENNKGFQVERLKASGNDWEILGFVAAKGKHINYEFTDNTPLSMSYYRLRQLDNNGKEVLSKVISLARKGTKGIKVYPTIVSNGSLNVEVTTAAVYGIYNQFGQQVLKGQVTQQIDVSALSTGTYVIKVGTEQAKFVKQ